MKFRIETDIPGYIAKVDGKEVGTTPVEVPLVNGQHTFQVLGQTAAPKGLKVVMSEVETLLVEGTPAEFRTAHRQAKDDRAAFQASPGYAFSLMATQAAQTAPNRYFTNFVVGDGAVFSGTETPVIPPEVGVALQQILGGIGSVFEQGTKAPAVAQSTDNSEPVVVHWTVGADVVRPEPEGAVAKGTKLVGETLETVGRSPLVNIAIGAGAAFGIVGIWNWLKGRR